mgnify:CR=1 FL=1
MRSQYGHIPSNSTSPERRTGQNSLLVSMQMNHKNDIEPIFKVFHFRPQYEQLKAMGYTEEHWAKNYFGVVMQSSSGLPVKY